MQYSVAEIAKIIGAEIVGSVPKQNITQVAFDSRKITNGKHSIFFTLKGKQKDGYAFIKDAQQKSVQIFVVEKSNVQIENACFLVVKNPLKALQNFATHHRKKFDLQTIAITGSNGKTIVKEWLNQLLYKQFSIVRSTKSFNSQIGVPLSVLQIDTAHTLGIFEAGISTTNEMQHLEEILKPNIGVFTNIGSAHSHGFPNQETHIKEKLNLFKFTKTLIYNSNHDLVEEIVDSNQQFSKQHAISFGTKETSTVRLLHTKSVNSGLEITFAYHETNYKYLLPFSDFASVENSLCLVATLLGLGLNLEIFLPKFKTLQAVEMRLEIKQAVRQSILINDTFNSDLQSIKIALDVLSEQKKPKKIMVLTDVQDSNLAAEELYQKVANLVNDYTIEQLILIGEEIVIHQYKFQSKCTTYSSTLAFLNDISNFRFSDTAILLKGARKFKLEEVAQRLEMQSHDTVLEVNLNALIANLNYFRGLLKPTTKMMAMVKAFSYGTGDYEIAQTLENQNIDYLGVAYADEGVTLRKAGIRTPIMVMNPEQSSYGTLIRYNLEPEIYSFRVLDLFLNELTKSSVSRTYPIHLKINTGMNRLGFKADDLDELILILKHTPQLKVASVFSHLAASDDADENAFTNEQIQRFDFASTKIEKLLGYRTIKHILLSHGIVKFNDYQHDMVRLGLGLYGFSSDNETQKHLQNLITFKTVISQINEISTNETVGYNRKFKATKPTKIATLPVGYADGVNRLLSNENGYVLIHQQKAPIIGNICMDMMMVNISGIDCAEGDEVVILGEKPNVKEIAKTLNTIPYEVMTSISPRVKRIYFKE